MVARANQKPDEKVEIVGTVRLQMNFLNMTALSDWFNGIKGLAIPADSILVREGDTNTFTCGIYSFNGLTPPVECVCPTLGECDAGEICQETNAENICIGQANPVCTTTATTPCPTDYIQTCWGTQQDATDGICAKECI